MTVDQTVAAPEPAPATTPAPEPLATTAPPAHRVEDPEQPWLQLDEDRGRDWYGWQTLTADGISIALIVAAGSSEVRGFAVAGILGLNLAAPIVHLAHGQGMAAGVSVGVRLLLGVVTVFGAFSCFQDVFDESEGSSTGCVVMTAGVIGYPVMAIVDAMVLAYEPRRAHGSAALRPWLDARAGAGGLAYRLAF